MVRSAAALMVLVSLAACGVVDSMNEGFKQATALESDLEEATGVRPQVGFNWRNGRLVLVTVQYPQPIDSRSLSDLAEVVRAAVIREFKQTPGNIVLAFSLPNHDPPPAH